MNIFIAEDDLALANVLSQYLPRAIEGATVTIKNDAIGAATTLQTIANGEKVNWPDIVISDYHLDNLTGDAVLKLGAKLFPEAKLILMSGAADTRNIETARATVPRPLAFLQKPFAQMELVALIKS